MNRDSLVLEAMERVEHAVEEAARTRDAKARSREVGRVSSVSEDVAWVSGLGSVRYEELLTVGRGVPAMAMEILPDRVGVALLGGGEVSSGSEVIRTGRVLDVPVGEAMLGRVINPLGEPLDRKGPIRADDRWHAQREAPSIIERAPVTRPLQTGLKVIDALLPIGRGQRELILGDRQTGKTAIAVDTIINQKGTGVACVFCSIGQRSSSVAKVVEELRRAGALEHTCVVVVEGEAPPGLQYMAPYAATSVAEYFMHQGRDALIVYDDLTRHARAYRQLSLLLRRPPGREAYPGDIFYIHSRMLERSTHLKPEHGDGSLTALPIIETEAENLSAYIPTNLISITDGQIYLSPGLFRKSVLPAVDVGLSVSRVGGKAQLPAYRKVAGDLRLSYSQYQELEVFARFGTRLDESTKRQLAHGRRVREALKQVQTDLLTAGEQIVILFAVSEGLMDEVPLERMDEAQKRLVEAARSRFEDLEQELAEAAKDDSVWKELETLVRDEVERIVREGGHGS